MSSRATPPHPLPPLPLELRQIAADIVRRGPPDVTAVLKAAEALKPGPRQYFGLIERQLK